MAVLREQKFILDIGSIVNTALSNFEKTRMEIYAKRDSNYQKMVNEQGLDYSSQLSYYQNLLNSLKKEKYPDSNYIITINKKIGVLSKLARQQKFRDRYMASLKDYLSSNKTLEDHIDFLKTERENAIDDEMKQQLDRLIGEASAKLLSIKQNIIANKIKFLQRDKTVKSLDEAIKLAKQQLSDPKVLNNDNLKENYQLTIQNLEMAKRGVAIEDKIHSLSASLAAGDYNYPAVEKVKFISNYLKTASNDSPIVIGGVKYNSEKDFWNETLNNYISSDFASDFAKEIKRMADNIYTSVGKLPMSSLTEFKKIVDNLKTDPNLANHQNVIEDATNSSLSYLLKLKSEDIVKENYLDKGGLATISNIEKAKKEISSLKDIFGDSISLDPSIHSLDEEISSLRTGEISNVISLVHQGMRNEGLSFEDALKKYGKLGMVEMSPQKVAEQPVAKSVRELYNKGEQLVNKGTEPQQPTEVKPEQQTKIQPQSEIDKNYWLKPNETISEYNKRIAEYEKQNDEMGNASQQSQQQLQQQQPKTLSEYYQQKGEKMPSWQERAPLYEKFGLGKSTEYVGSAEQNAKLLEKLLNNK